MNKPIHVMRKSGIPLKVFIKYTLLQIPAIILITIIMLVIHKFNPYPHIIKVIILSVWIIKDIIMFPFVWQSYDSHPENTHHSMINKEGITKDRLAPSGYIYVGKELWKATIPPEHPPVEKNKAVIIQEIDGLRLTVVKKG